MRLFKLISLLFITASGLNASAQSADEVKYEVACIGFYNVENLFDTLDTEFKRDDQFLPEGENKWNTERYLHKLDQISKVVSALGTDYSSDGMAILGLSEIENRKVIEDLVATDLLKDKNYQIVHYESPDRRGIDVGLIYQPKYFEYESSQSIRVVMPSDTAFRTRDQLLVTGNLRGERVHLMVVHWPSRSGGQKRSEPKRLMAAQTGKTVIDSILKAEPDAKIIYMGDLNDDPTNKSLRKIMKAGSARPEIGKRDLYNPMMELYRNGIGSLAWRDTWNLFDQILLSPAWVDQDLSDWSYNTTRVYNKPHLCNDSGSFKGYPWRTFAGGAWTAGYSDHFPVYSVLIREL